MKWGSIINKTLVLGVVLTGLTVNTCAATKATTKTAAATSTLTLEQAVNRAISSCDKKEVYGSYKEAYEEVNQYNQDVFSTTYRTSVNNEKLNAYNLKHINEKLAYDATDLYLEVVRLNKKIATDKNKITVKEKELNQIQIKRDKGTASDLDYKTVENELITARASLIADQDDLETSVMKFRNLTNMDITSYELEDEFTLEPVAIEGAVSSYFDQNLEDYWDILKDGVDIKELGKEYYVGSSLGDYKMYEAGKTQSEYNFKDTQKQTITTLKSYYNSLPTLKENANIFEEQLKLADQNLKATTIKLDRGVISQLEYEQSLLKEQDIKDSLFATTKQYLLTKMMVEHPSILVVGGSGQIVSSEQTEQGNDK